MTTIVYGGSLAALVAAEQIAAAGGDVTHVTPSPHLGGHFAGTSVGGARCDAGLVIFEYGTLNAHGWPDPLGYDPDVRNDCGRFGNVLASYTESLGITLTRVPAFRLWTGDALIPDFVFDTRVEGMRALPALLAQRAYADVRAILAAGEHALHARRKYIEPRFGDLSYEAASLANHGDTLHEAFFAPFARKVTGQGASELLALYSRAAWLPLFWPETIAASLGGDDPRLPETPFHVVRGGAVADLIAALSARLAASQRVKRIVAPARAISTGRNGVALDLGAETCHGTHLVWGHDLDELTRLTGAGPTPDVPRASVAIVLARIPRAQVADASLGTVILPGDHALPYRITNQSTNAATPDESLVRLSIEWGGKDAPPDDASLLAATRAALVRIGLARPDVQFVDTRVLRIARALVLPSAASRDALLGMRRSVEALGLPILPVAPAAGFGVASLNDQLVQGMKAARHALSAAQPTQAGTTSALPNAAAA